MLILIFSAAATALAAAATAAAWGYALGLRGRLATLTRELDRAHGERHEAFLAALRMADTAGAHSAAEYVLHAHAAAAEDLPDDMDELERREEEDALNDPLFQHLEDLEDADAGLLYDPLDTGAAAV